MFLSFYFVIIHHDVRYKSRQYCKWLRSQCQYYGNITDCSNQLKKQRPLATDHVISHQVLHVLFDLDGRIYKSILREFPVASCFCLDLRRLLPFGFLPIPSANDCLFSEVLRVRSLLESSLLFSLCLVSLLQLRSPRIFKHRRSHCEMFIA